MPEFYITDKMTEEQQREVHRKMSETFREVTYIDDKGKKVARPKEVGRDGPLAAVCPHPKLGIVDVRSDDPDIRRKAVAELGHEPKDETEYRDTLTIVAREKGWNVIWAKPAAIRRKKVAKRRGRPKGSKDKKPRKRRSKK